VFPRSHQASLTKDVTNIGRWRNGDIELGLGGSGDLFAIVAVFEGLVESDERSLIPDRPSRSRHTRTRPPAPAPAGTVQTGTVPIFPSRVGLRRFANVIGMSHQRVGQILEKKGCDAGAESSVNQDVL
jgi:hypothetical protein